MCFFHQRAILSSEWAERTCQIDGRWQISPEVEAGSLLDQAPSDLSSGQGWTDYNPCFLPEIRDLMKQLEAGSRQETEKKMLVAHWTRVLELTGLTVSLISLIVSLFIFTYFRYSINVTG